MKNLLFVLLAIMPLFIFAQNDSYSNKNRAYITAQDFVKEKLNNPFDAKFNDNIIHETQDQGKCTVLGKVIVKNSFGTSTEYSYKIWLVHNGKDWDDKRNWSYSKLILENTSTGKQQVFRGTATFNPQKDTSVKKIGAVNGISCTVIEKNSSFTRIVTSQKMSESQMKKVVSDLGVSTNIIYFHLPNKKTAGQEYAMKNKDLILIY